MDQVVPNTVSSTPSNAPICTQCHIQVRESDYFCFNCGKNLKPKPLSTSALTQCMYYLGSIFLPPMGFIWGIRYLREKSPVAKVVGIICIALTIIVLIIAVQATVAVMNTVNQQINSQTQNFMQF